LGGGGSGIRRNALPKIKGDQTTPNRRKKREKLRGMPVTGSSKKKLATSYKRTGGKQHMVGGRMEGKKDQKGRKHCYQRGVDK